MTKPPTIRDVAREAEASVAVVSRVLNDGTGPVAPATRERVLAAIERLGYRPKAAARNLNGGATTIGLIVTDLANPFFARLADRIVWEARTSGVQVQLMTTQEDPHLEAEILDRLRDRSVSGIIATPTGANAAKWQRLREVGIDLTFVDRSIASLSDVDLVRIKNEESARVATEHLVSLGHRRIGFISGPLSTSTGEERVRGYQEVLREHGLEPEPQLIHPIPFRGDSGADAAGALISLTDRPTALIVANTAQVRSALRRLMQSNLRIPDELSLVVFDDNPWTELITPPLTVIRQPIDMLAVHSLELVLSRMQGRVPHAPRVVSVASDFVARSSSAHAAPANTRSSHSHSATAQSQEFS